MTVKELQKILQQGINLYSKYKPSDIIICDVDENYSANRWKAPYLTVDNGYFSYCGIALSNKNRGGANKVMSENDYFKAVEDGKYDEEPSVAFHVRELKKVLTDAVRKLSTMEPEAKIRVDLGRGSTRFEAPFVCLYDNEDDFYFVILTNIEIDDDYKYYDDYEENMKESKKITFNQLKKHLISESISAKREIFEDADIWIDEQINMDNPNYTFQKMREYASSPETIPASIINEIIEGILDMFHETISDEARELLQGSLGGETYTDLVLDAIYEAITQLADSLDMFA